MGENTHIPTELLFVIEDHGSRQEGERRNKDEGVDFTSLKNHRYDPGRQRWSLHTASP
jgi:hypothetical protein